MKITFAGDSTVCTHGLTGTWCVGEFLALGLSTAADVGHVPGEDEDLHPGSLQGWQGSLGGQYQGSYRSWKPGKVMEF